MGQCPLFVKKGGTGRGSIKDMVLLWGSINNEFADRAARCLRQRSWASIGETALTAEGGAQINT